MKIIQNRQILENDLWQHDNGDANLPSGPVFISLTRWRAQREALLPYVRQGWLGIRLEAEDDVSRIAGVLGIFPAIALVFSVFTEGRGYSQARLLRKRYGYQGQIRATGDIRRDQLAFLERVGVDTVELAEDQDVESSLGAYGDISVQYQPASSQSDQACSHVAHLQNTKHPTVHL